MRNRVGVGVLVLGLVALGGVAWAQSPTASLSGRVTDESGAVLPGATVTITNADTNVQAWQGTTDQAGNYFAPSLPVGRYDIAVSLAAFKTKAIQGVPLTVGQKANIPVTLPAGEVRETITVVGETMGRLETEDSSMGLVVDSSQIRDLPLSNRAVLSLLTLVGGVSAGGTGSNLNASQLSMNGSRTLNSEFSVDGVSVVTGSTGGVQRLPSTEAIREFKVQTAGYSAEFGRSAGGFVNMVIHSGTNELHGGVYEYYRHEKLNANSFFNNLRQPTPLPKPRDRDNRFGLKLGGPVRIPGVYKGDDRTFFFLNYEGVRSTNPSSPTSNIPDERWRAGDFSSFPGQIIDPQTGQPFPGNRIPDGRIDPASRRIMSLVPLPNTQGTLDPVNGRYTSNYVNDLSLKPTQDEITLRLDHHVGGKTRLNARLTYYDLFGPAAPNIPGPLTNTTGDSFTKGYQLSAGWNHVWSPSILSDINFGYYRNDPVIDPPTAGMDVAATYGIARSVYAASPRFEISGFRALGIDANTLRRQIDNNYHASAVLTWVHGSHTTKFGAQARINNFDVFNPGGDFTGVYRFNGEITSPTRAANNPAQAMADFLLGAVKTSVYDLPQPRTVRQNHNLAAFVQNDWKVGPRLTVNAGLRYEYEAPMTIDNDVYSRLDIAPGSVGRLLVAGLNSSRSLDVGDDKVNFAPRVGLAYMLDDKTVLRSAVGLFYGQIFSNLGGIVAYPGFTVRQEFPSLGAGAAQPFRLNEGMPLTAVQNLDDPFFVERGTSASRPLSVQSGGNNQFGRVAPLPYSMQWNLGVQRELWAGTIMDVSYVGSRGYNLPVLRNQNAVPLDRTQEVAQQPAAVVQAARPNPNVTSFAAFVHEGDSWYHSAQVRLSRKFSERLSFQTTYTFAKSIDNGSGIFNFSQPQGLDVGDLAGAPGISEDRNRGLSAFDRPHTLAISAQYETGGPGWLRGFQANVIVIARSGMVDTVAQTNLADWNIIPSLPGASGLQQRPIVRAGASLGLSVPQEPAGNAVRYLLAANDPSFPFTPAGPFYAGSGASRRLVVPFDPDAPIVGRSTVRGPGEFNVDLALARRFQVTKRVGFTVRAEAFNALNHTNLNNPDTSLTVAADPAGNAIFNSPSFGLITGAKPSRTMQLVGRIDF